MEPFFHARADCLAERLLDFALDDEGYAAEARPIRVIERKSMMKCPSSSTGVICLSPPKRLPIPAAMMTSVGSCVKANTLLFTFVIPFYPVSVQKATSDFQTQEERPRNDLRALYDVSLSECLGGRQWLRAGT